MATISNSLDEEPRRKLHLFDLPREVKDQIYGYVIRSAHTILPLRVPGIKLQGDDFRHESILRVSKRMRCEAMQVLQRRSWSIYNMQWMSRDSSVLREAPTQYMMNVELDVRSCCGYEHMTPIILNFAGTDILRRTCQILMYSTSRPLTYYYQPDAASAIQLRRFFQLIKLLTGFATVILQINVDPGGLYPQDKHRVLVFDRVKLLRDIKAVLEPALGPAMPCKPVREQCLGMNFSFSPRQHLAKRLASAELGV